MCIKLHYVRYQHTSVKSILRVVLLGFELDA